MTDKIVKVEQLAKDVDPSTVSLATDSVASACAKIIIRRFGPLHVL